MKAGEKMKKGQEDKGALVRYAFFPLTAVWSELVLRLCIYRGLPEGTLRAFLYAGVVGCVITALTICFPKNVNRVIGYVSLTAGMALFMTQMIYFTIFRRFLSFGVAAGVGTDVLEFRQQIMNTILARWYGVVLLLVPLLLRILLDLYGFSFTPVALRRLLLPAGTAVGLYLCFLFTIVSGDKKEFSAWSLYFKEWEAEQGAKKLGLFVAMGKDLFHSAAGGQESGKLDVLTGGASGQPTLLPPKSDVGSEPEPDENEENPDSAEKVPVATPTPKPEYHRLYDFAALAEKEKNESVKTIHSYLAQIAPDPKNKYTGMFEGYNYIMITAEGFSPWAVEEELTPTLYKLTHNGFVFNNFYTPLWHTSTSDGEYIACTGLVPDGALSMKRSAGNDMRLAFGNQFSALGYKTVAYHNNTYDYYHREKTHPNLGYTYKGIGNGLKLPFNGWPRSDYEMMVATLPEYIGDEPFHAYYMTVSGHMQYTFIDNSMASRNKEAVASLPYSDHARAYLACNYELEKALTYLLEQLEAAGIAERTVIALYADHYPYGLEKECIDELAGHVVEEQFELYKNYFVLYCAGMKEPIEVDKYCSCLDIAPTVSNLFGLSYDSRLFAGSDILSDKEGLVIFDNKSYITDRVMFDSTTGKVTLLTGVPVSQDYLDRKLLEVKQKIALSKGILDNDYYSYLP